MNNRQQRRLITGFSALLMITLLLALMMPATINAQGGENPDGRLNPEPLIPFAIYCNSSNVQLWKVNAQSMGDLAIQTGMAQVINVLRQAAINRQNIQIAASGYISLWALASGQLQAVSLDPSKPRYTYNFGLDRCGASISLPVT